MAEVKLKGRTYEVDVEGFLLDETTWNEDFAEALAPRLGIDGGLTDAHWLVLNYIRQAHARTGRSPMVYETCRDRSLSLSALRRLFPTGHWRGACKLAGMTYLCSRPTGKTYRIDARGYLIEPGEWDRNFAARARTAVCAARYATGIST